MEAYDTRSTPADETNRNVRQWLSLLLITQLAGFLFSILTKIPVLSAANVWLQPIVTAATVYVLYQLRQHRFYRTAALFLFCSFALTLLRRLISSNFFLSGIYRLFQTTGLMVLGYISGGLVFVRFGCELVAVLLEYTAHSSLVKPTHQRMATVWIWVMAATLVLSITTSAAGVILANMVQREVMEVAQYQTIYPLLTLPNTLATITYILCLFQTQRLLQKT